MEVEDGCGGPLLAAPTSCCGTGPAAAAVAVTTAEMLAPAATAAVAAVEPGWLAAAAADETEAALALGAAAARAAVLSCRWLPEGGSLSILGRVNSEMGQKRDSTVVFQTGERFVVILFIPFSLAPGGELGSVVDGVLDNVRVRVSRILDAGPPSLRHRS